MLVLVYQVLSDKHLLLRSFTVADVMLHYCPLLEVVSYCFKEKMKENENEADFNCDLFHLC